MFWQMPVPTSMTDWCISGLTASLQERLALLDDLHVDVRAEIAGFRIDGLIFFLDADVKLGFMLSRCDEQPPILRIQKARPAQFLHGLFVAQRLLDGQSAPRRSTIHSKFSGPTE